MRTQGLAWSQAEASMSGMTDPVAIPALRRSEHERAVQMQQIGVAIRLVAGFSFG
jgi:hypothetical protein